MVSYSSVCPALGLLLALSAFCSAQQAATQNPVAVAEAQNKYSTKIKDCYSKDMSKFTSCILQEVNATKNSLINGNSELGVPSLTPLRIPKIELTEKGALLEGYGRATDIEVYGGDKFEIQDLKIDGKKGEVVLNVFIPALYISGKYKVNGTAILLPVEGEGKFNMNLTTIDAIVTATLARHGSTGVKLDKVNIDFTIKDAGGRMDGLYGDDDTVGEAINSLLNEHAQQILTEVKPIVNQMMGKEIFKIIGSSFLDLPAQAFVDAGFTV